MPLRVSARLAINPVRTFRAGFSLLEIVVALALVAIISGAAIINFGAVFGGIESRPPDQIFRSAVRLARYEAAVRQKRTYLVFDAEQNLLRISDADGEPCGELPLARAVDGERFEVEFFPIRPEETIGTADSNQPSEYPIPRLVFDPSGCGIPVKVAIRGAGEHLEFLLDPFCWGEPPKREP